MLSLTHVITHLETGECFRLPDAATHLLRVLGKWWYSVLYMEISEHVQIRQGRADMKVMGDFIEAGTLKPFICRAEGCGEKFGRLNLLIDHVERGTCKWTLETLRLDQLEHEFLHYLGETDLFKT